MAVPQLRSESPYGDTFSVVGVSHKTLGIEERELLSKKEALTPKVFAEAGGLSEVAVISTCNRFEILSVGRDAREDLSSFLKGRLGGKLSDKGIYAYRNADAVRHLFRVASSLDSLVVGEAQILGQVKESYKEAVAAGLAGPRLHHWFQFSFHVAKKVREHTAVGERGVSVSYVAVKLAQQIFGSLADRSVMIIGSGRMAELAALHLRSYGCGKIIVANRTIERAGELANRISGSAISLFEVADYLPKVDVVIGSITLDRPIVETAQVRKIALGRPLLMVDLGVPRNFQSTLGDLDNVYLYDVDDLAHVADDNKQIREEAARDAEIVIEYGLFQFERWLTKLSAEPAILDFRAKVREACAAELRAVLQGTVPQEKLDAIVPELSARLGQKLSHDITQLLAKTPGGKIDQRRLLALLFEELL